MGQGEPFTVDYFVKRSAVDQVTGCWMWTGAKCSGGYGKITRGGKWFKPHRVFYQVYYNCSVLPDIEVCHHCDTPLCINPEHLFLGTHADNMKDCALKGRHKRADIKGEDCTNAKLTEREVIEIRTLGKEFTHSRLAKLYGVARQTISHILAYERWKHVP